MNLVLMIVGVAVATFCVWLTEQIVKRRERWAKWTLAAVIVGLPVLYVVSFGPACWITSRFPYFQGTINRIYWPFARVVWEYQPRREGLDALLWYGTLLESGSNPATRNVLNAAAPP